MTEQASSTVGRAAIDAYLDAVELAMIAADAPRIDRLQVLQDLDSQIADMLAGQPTPLTEESVRAVIAKLEPPDHFAATYGQASASTPPASSASSMVPRRSFRLPRPNWPAIAAASAVVLVMGGISALLAAASGPNDFWIFMMLLGCSIGLVLTPFAIWEAYRQLRIESGASRRRDLMLFATFVYGIVAPLLAVWLAASLTGGAVFLAIGVVAFLYAQYILLRRGLHRMSETLPPQPAAPPSKSNGHNPGPPVTSATPMPAV